MPAGIDHLIHPGGETSTVGEPSFERELFVPPLLEPRVDERGRKVFDLRFTAGRSELLPGTWTETGA